MAEAKVMSAKMKSIMKALQEKFPSEKVKSKPGRGGNYDYIPTQEIIDRLNDVFGCCWSAYEVESKIFGGPQGQPNYVVKRVCIEVADPDSPDRKWLREGWGGHPILPNSDLGDAMKSAYSKAFTKAASNFGIGLYLWGVDVDEDDNAPVGQGYPPQGQQTPQVTVVNPGAHNPIPQSPQFNNPGAPAPPSTVASPPMSGGEAASYPNMAGQYIDNSQSSTITSGPQIPGATPVPPAAQLNIQSAGQGDRPPHVQQGGDSPIQPFQINAIKGMASTVGIDPMVAVQQALGPASANIPAVEHLTSSQAIDVLKYLKEGPPA